MIETLAMLLIIGAILGFALLVTLGWVIGTYNYFKTAIQDIRNMWSNILSEYQRRYDLFMNLSNTVKSYKNHERGVLTEIAKARSGLANEVNPKKQAKIMKKMDSLFAGMRIQLEAYPELKADGTHKDLMKEIRITEDRINIARTSVNDIINEYNTNVNVFPTSFLAGIFGFKEYDYYEGDKVRATNNAPEVAL